jgi:hypothetical protein
MILLSLCVIFCHTAWVNRSFTFLYCKNWVVNITTKINGSEILATAGLTTFWVVTDHYTSNLLQEKGVIITTNQRCQNITISSRLSLPCNYIALIRHTCSTYTCLWNASFKCVPTPDIMICNVIWSTQRMHGYIIKSNLCSVHNNNIVRIYMSKSVNLW